MEVTKRFMGLVLLSGMLLFSGMMVPEASAGGQGNLSYGSSYAILVDNSDSSGYAETGSWGSHTKNCVNGSLREGTSDTNAPNKTATWTFTDVPAGDYAVVVTYIAENNRSQNAPYTINHDGGSSSVTISQYLSTADKQNNYNDVWPLLERSLGIFSFDGTSSVVLSNATDGHVIADSCRLIPDFVDDSHGGSDFVMTGGWGLQETGDSYRGFVDTAREANWEDTKTATWNFDVAAGDYEVLISWRAESNRSTAAPYSVDGGSTIYVDQTDGRTSGGYHQAYASLGTHYLSGAVDVELSNSSIGSGKVIIADSCRLIAVNCGEVVVDNLSPTDFSTTGNWDLFVTGDSDRGTYDTGLEAKSSGATATWSFDVTGEYEIFVTWRAESNRSTDVGYTVNGGSRISVDQYVPGSWEIKTESLGTYTLAGAGNVTVTRGSSGETIADSITLVAAPLSITWTDLGLNLTGEGTAELWPPNHRMVTLTVAGGSNATITAVEGVDFAQGAGGLMHDPDVIVAQDGLSVQIRAERSGRGKTGRVYTVTAEDDCETIVLIITVPHN